MHSRELMTLEGFKANEDAVAVVGRGIIGLACAFELLRRGRKVILLGPDCFSACSASACVVGLSAMKGLTLPRHTMFLAKFLGHYAFPAWLKTLEQAGAGSVDLVQGQVFEPFRSQEEYAQIRKRAFALDYTGLCAVETLDAARCEVLDPSRVLGTFRYLHDYWFDGEKLLINLGQFVQSRAEEVLADFVLEKIEVGEQRRLSLFSVGGKSISVGACVLAAGIGCDRILKNSNLLDLRQKAVPGTTLCANVNFLYSNSLIFGAASLNFHAQSMRYGGLADVSSAVASNTVPYTYLPAGLVLQGSELRSGERSLLRDRMPAVGLVDAHLPNLLLASGFYKNAFSLAPMAASLICAHLNPDRAEAPDTPWPSTFGSIFSPLRFRK